MGKAKSVPNGGLIRALAAWQLARKHAVVTPVIDET